MNDQVSHQSTGLNMAKIYPNKGWKRILFKAPLYTWRLGLGPLVGKVIMVITTTGRKSGLPRHTMVEFHKLNGVKYAPCAFGSRSSWYQNILANPLVTVQSADGTERMRAARITDDEELLSVYHLFKRRDPPLLDWYLKSLDIESNPEDVLAKQDRIHILRFDPVDAVTPPGLEVDLAWLWPLALLIVLLPYFFRPSRTD